jgi:hypothetical protein
LDSLHGLAIRGLFIGLIGGRLVLSPVAVVGLDIVRGRIGAVLRMKISCRSGERTT